MAEGAAKERSGRDHVPSKFYRKWTEREDVAMIEVVAHYVAMGYSIDAGLRIAAGHLGRTPGAVAFRYYSAVKHRIDKDNHNENITINDLNNDNVIGINSDRQIDRVQRTALAHYLTAWLKQKGGAPNGKPKI